MDERQIGRSYKAIRLRLRLTQEELGVASGTSRFVVARIERGRLANVSAGSLRAVASALDADLDLRIRWRGGDLGRILNARHAAMHEAVAKLFASFSEWVVEPEVSFSIDRERGVIDALGWHTTTRTALVVELKSELVDINELMSTMDVRVRLAPTIGRSRGRTSVNVGCWVAIAEGRTNRRRVARHRLTLGSKFPDDGHSIRAWLRSPIGPIRALSFLPIEQHAHGGATVSGQSRVRHAQARLPAPSNPRQM